MKIIIPENIETLPERSISLPHAGDYYLNILSCLGYAPEKAPVADLLKEVHGLTGEWLVVSPIYWQATHNDVLVMAYGKQLQSYEDEGLAWYSAFQELARSWDFETFYHDEWTWLVRPKQAPEMDAKPISRLLHRSMMPELQTLDKTMCWQRQLTEAQLFFSAHVLNRQRPAHFPINGVWFWGQGLFKQGSCQIVIQNDALMTLAKTLSHHVQIALEKRRYSEDTLLLINYLDDDTLKMINPRRSHIWYWNNQTYRIKQKPWWLSF